MKHSSFEKSSESSDGEPDDEDSCTRQWRKATVTLKDLKKTIHRLEQLLVKKEQVIKELRDELRIKDRQITRHEKAYKQLSQLLSAERSYYNREKENYFNELLKIKNLITTNAVSKRAPYPIYRTVNSTNKDSVPEYANICVELGALKMENKKLRLLIETADEQNVELCDRYFRMRDKKEELFKKCREIEDDFLQSLQTVMMRFNELRKEVNGIMDNVTPVCSLEERILQVTRNNHELAYENSFLRLELQCLRRNKIAHYSTRSTRFQDADIRERKPKTVIKCRRASV